MIEKAYLAFVGVVALATAVAAGVFAGAYALFEVLRAPLGPAGAAGVVALAIFTLIGLSAALIAFSRRRPARQTQEQGLPAKLLQLARDRPIVAVGALIAAGVVVARNPKLMTAVLSAFVAGQSTRKS